ncbi:MAG: DUF896 domain-containing protein [Acutalibacteraceae bacterium]|nr:DUF896 domain-containing protein [Acutalibacteraceae bacterium]
MEKSKLERISQLAKKKKTEGLTEQEQQEQKELYSEYIGEFRASLRGQLDNMIIQNPDGTQIPVKDMRKNK